MKLIFPTVKEVANSIEGWRAGGSLPVPQKNHKLFMSSMMSRWSDSGLSDGTTKRSKDERHCAGMHTVCPYKIRCRAMPHIKSYCVYENLSHSAKDNTGQGVGRIHVDTTTVRLHYVLLTSANLSKAAWGQEQLNASQLCIRSYELGVLFTAAQARTYSFTLGLF